LLRMHGVTPFRLDIANFTRYILGGQVLCGTAVKFVMESQKPRPVSAKDAETRTGHPQELRWTSSVGYPPNPVRTERARS
jgi:hypothetical protein